MPSKIGERCGSFHCSVVAWPYLPRQSRGPMVLRGTTRLFRTPPNDSRFGAHAL